MDIKLTDQDLHCMARILQSCLFAPEPASSFFYGCFYCKYKMDCFGKDVNGKDHIKVLREHLESLTGVYLGICARSPLEAVFLPASYQQEHPEDYIEFIKNQWCKNGSRQLVNIEL